MASLNPLQGQLGHRRAAHLLRRTSFRYTKPKIDQMAGQNITQALNSLLVDTYPLQTDQPIYDDLLTTQVNENVTWILPAPGTPIDDLPVQDFALRPYVVTWFANELMHDPGISHKMTWFFHQYMVVTANTIRSSNFFDYLSLLRHYSLGNYKKLATKLIFDNCMLAYLNNNENTKGNPNENFAREYFELFTIGKGSQIGPGDYTNYTEEDIVQAARVLTGIRVRINRDVMDTETNIPRGSVPTSQTQYNNLHDTGNKTFSSKFQNTVIAGAPTIDTHINEINAFVDMIFAQPETAKNLCRRLYRFFVSPSISAEIENDIIVPLSNTLINNNFELKPVLEQLFKSQHFFDADDSDNKDEIIGSMIKSPLELVYQSMNMFGVPLPDAQTQPANVFRLHGRAINQRVFSVATLPFLYPADVAGYPAYYQHPEYSRAWFGSSSIIARYKWPQVLLTGNANYTSTGGAVNMGTKLNVAQWLKESGFVSDPKDSYIVVQELLKYMLPEEVDNDRFNYFLEDVFLDNLPPADWTYEWENYLSSGNDSEVKIALERLINAIMYSPEYQTF